MEARTNTAGAMAPGLCALPGLLAQLRAAARNEAGARLESLVRGRVEIPSELQERRAAAARAALEKIAADRRKVLVATLKRRGRMSRAHIAQALQWPLSTTTLRLYDAVSLNLIKRRLYGGVVYWEAL